MDSFPFFGSIMESDGDLMASFFADFDVDAKDMYGKTSLHLTIESGCGLAEVQRLLFLGADVNAVDVFLNTPLHSAVMSGSDVEIVDALLDAGADVNVKNQFDETALFFAVQNSRKLEVIKSLLSAGGDINGSIIEGNLLHVVRQVEIARELFAYGINVNATNQIGLTPLHCVLLSPPLGNILALVEELLRQGAEVNAKDYLDQRRTPLYVLTITRLPKYIVRGRRECLETPLCSVMGCSHEMEVDHEDKELVRMLTSYGGDVNMKCGSRTSFEEALVAGSIAWAKVLVKFALLKNYDDNRKHFINLDLCENISDQCELHMFITKCVDEIRFMKRHKVNDNLNLYDFLNKFDQSFSIIPLLSVRRSIEAELVTNYVIYYDIVATKLKQCWERFDLIDKIKGSWITVHSGNLEILLDYEYMLNVIQYLPNRDLFTFVTSSG